MNETNEIKALCEKYGYGQVMNVASDLWEKATEEACMPLSGVLIPVLPSDIKRTLGTDPSRPLYEFGMKVLIDKNIAGIILDWGNYGSDGDPHFFYRVLIDANELCYRVFHGHIDQRDRHDLFSEDFGNLISETTQFAVMQIGEENLSSFY